MKYFFSFLFLLILTSGCTERRELGTKMNPIKIALIPGKDTNVLLENGLLLKKWLEEKTPYHYDVFVPHSYVAVIEAMGSKRADIAVLNTFGYLLANEKYKVEAIFTLTNQNTATYKGEIIAHKNGPQKLTDLNNKRIAFVDPLSASGHLMPAALFKENGVKIKDQVFAGRHDTVVTMVYQKQVDAGATFYALDESGEPMDGRRLIITQYPDVFEKVKVIAYTKELPNEALAIRADIDSKIKTDLISSLEEWIKTREGKNTLKGLYNCDGLKRATDADYEPARKLLKQLGKSVQDLSI
ncbi:MAG: hypothetical protein BroJett040_13160 [Oligoflexia bacterium]|nr:MAG: hypothetical protein BroJett040_13160 [Oligoflexia bacterium]